MFIDNSRAKAQEFLAKVLPWGEPDAFYNIHFKKNILDRGGRPIWSGLFSKDLPGLMKSYDKARLNPQVSDIYICMSSQSQTEDRQGKDGRTFPIAHRSSLTALSLRGLFIDIDVKEGAYETTADAVKALKDFITATGMPGITAVVATGSGGIHAHWSFEERLATADWQPLADALAEATKVHGLICDTQCTVDAARILRIPGTLNRKTDTPKKVELLRLGNFADIEKVRAALAPHMGKVQRISPTLTPRGNFAANDELGGGIGGGNAPAVIEEVEAKCAVVSDALKDGGKDHANPLWHLMVGLSIFFEEGRDIAHKLSCGHPSYDPDVVDREFDRMERERALRPDRGWTRCKAIKGAGASQCITCEHYGDGMRSPCHTKVGNIPLVGPKLANLDMPAGFLRTADGFIVANRQDEEGKTYQIRILPDAIYDAWLSYSGEWVLHFIHANGGARRSEFSAPLNKLFSMNGVVTLFAGACMPIADNAIKAVRDFLVSWVHKLKDCKDKVVTAVPLGWAETQNGKLEGFTYAGKVWGKGTERPAAQDDTVFAARYRPRGDADAWKEAAKIITVQKRPALDAIIAASFAGPLLRFTGFDGVMMSAYSSESGIGKSTTMEVAQAVWGDPKTAMCSLSDTPKSAADKLAKLNSLPMFWDEIKGEEQTARFSVFAFQLSGGKDMSRLTHDIKQRAVGTWQTILVSATNDSLVDPIMKTTKSTTAGLYRLFEYPVAPGTMGQLEPGYVKRTVAGLRHHYGAVGLEYAKFLGANHEQIIVEVAKMYDALRAKYNATNDERQWVATMAVVLMGAHYANKLGFTDIDMKALQVFMASILGRMRGLVASAPVDMKNNKSVLSILTQFLSDARARHTLRTNKVHNQRGKPARGSIQVVGSIDRLEGIQVQIGQEDGIMRISSAALTKWCTRNEYSRHSFTEALEKEFGSKKVNACLGSGTDMVAGMDWLIELDLNHPKLLGFLG